MAQRGVKDFLRGESTHDHGVLGDPERWGDVATLSIHIPASDVSRTVTVRSKQLIRAQAPQLLARQWLVFGNWKLVAPAAANVSVGKITALIEAGVGQGTLRLKAQLAPQAPLTPATPFVLANTNAEGSLELGSIAAAAIAIAYEATLGAPSGNAVDVKLILGASVAPRAL